MPRIRISVAKSMRVAVEFLIMYSKVTATQPKTPALSESMSRTSADCAVPGHWAWPPCPAFAAASWASCASQPSTMFWMPPAPGNWTLLAKPFTRHCKDDTSRIAWSVWAQTSMAKFSTDCHVGTTLRMAPSYLSWLALSSSRASWALSRRVLRCFLTSWRSGDIVALTDLAWLTYTTARRPKSSKVVFSCSKLRSPRRDV
mmetsp:Transcript_115373/g.337337  ORF Transcript_115373/g.337337 Transcript_115373/m.337337 type:complete len:201 (-) Transcript_115373:763-1365(-)